MTTERVVEIPWMVQQLKTLPKIEKLLDLGSKNATYLKDFSNLAKEPLTLVDATKIYKKDLPKGYAFDVHKMLIQYMPNEWEQAFDVVTAVSTLDHVGLAAYGLDEDETALQSCVNAITMVCKQEGHLLLSVPISDKDFISKHKYEKGYQPQRVFSPLTIVELFGSPMWEIQNVTYFRRKQGQYVKCASHGIVGSKYPGGYAESVMCYHVKKVGSL